MFPTWFPASYAILTEMVSMSYAVRRPVPFTALRGVEPLSSLKMNTGFQLDSNQYLRRCSFRRFPFCLRRKSKLLAPSFLGQLNYKTPLQKVPPHLESNQVSHGPDRASYPMNDEKTEKESRPVPSHLFLQINQPLIMRTNTMFSIPRRYGDSTLDRWTGLHDRLFSLLREKDSRPVPTT